MTTQASYSLESLEDREAIVSSSEGATYRCTFSATVERYDGISVELTVEKLESLDEEGELVGVEQDTGILYEVQEVVIAAIVRKCEERPHWCEE